MSLNKKRLADARLYLILDTQVANYTRLLAVLKEAVRCGVDIVQLRDKNGRAKDILRFCQQAQQVIAGRALFIVNDRVDLALCAKADGVHVGQDDLSYQDARRLMGKNAIIGISCQTLAHARKAQLDGADYIGFGSVFKTLTKPERNPLNVNILRQVLLKIKTPTFFIGGINRSNMHQLTNIGAKRIAVCRDILLAKNPAGVCKDLLR